MNSDTHPQEVRLRPYLTIVMAIMIVWIASRASAQSPVAQVSFDSIASDVHPVQSIAYDGASVGIISPESDAPLRSVKPVMVEMNPVLANLDSDSAADGYRVDLALRDASGNVVAMRASARFELVPRVPLADRNRLTFADVKPMVWSESLDFDQRGIATVQLPFRDSFQPLFGWPSAIGPERLSASNHRSGSIAGFRRAGRGIKRTGRGRFGRDLTAAGWDWQNHVGLPSVGLLKVRVSVPTAGVYESTSLVRLRPPYGPIDSRWVGQ